MGPWLKSFAVIKSTAPVKSSFLTLPYPIRTISSKAEASSDN